MLRPLREIEDEAAQRESHENSVQGTTHPELRGFHFGQAEHSAPVAVGLRAWVR